MICNKCNADLPEKKFEKRYRFKGDMSRRGTCNSCRACMPKRIKERWDLMRIRSRKACLEYIREQKRAPCMDCGIQYPFFVMQFDHRPGTTKLFNLGEAPRGQSLRTVMAEIAKCDLVCANCHAARTYYRSAETIEF